MKMRTISWVDFYKTFISIKETVPSYRLGQHFINMFIKDESDEVVQGLWKKSGDAAFFQCQEVINKYQWDVQALPVVNRFEVDIDLK